MGKGTCAHSREVSLCSHCGWDVTSGSSILGFPTMMDCDLELRAKTNPFLHDMAFCWKCWVRVRVRDSTFAGKKKSRAYTEHMTDFII